MEVAISLPIRTWAALDAALSFFRAPPGKLGDGRLTRACQRLHRSLRKAGIRSSYALLGTLDSGKSLLRLHVTSGPPQREPWLLPLGARLARCLAEGCLTVMRVQVDPELGALLDYEAEELQACRAFLSELRRQWPDVRLARKARGPQPVRWDERGQEFVFTMAVAKRVQGHYLRAGAGVN